MDEDNFISNEEWLYRSVRNQETECYFNDDGQLIIKPDAFRDRNKEPSVDRAKLRNFNPSLSKLSETDGVVSLNTYCVRSIGEVKTNKDDGDLTHSVDVIYEPTPENLAHSKITVEPNFFGSEKKQKNAFKLLRISLARLATQKGWILKP
ncbi:MAG: hypothetical protein JSR32_00395 [Proteobacteria bacterium]|nr:hypothetical protein [Pseudomonadota bacterium]